MKLSPDCLTVAAHCVFFVPDSASPCYGVAIPALYGICISVRIEQLVSSTIRTSAHYSICHVRSFRRCGMLGWHWISYGRLIKVWLAHCDCWFEVVICGFQVESGTLIHGCAVGRRSRCFSAARVNRSDLGKTTYSPRVASIGSICGTSCQGLRRVSHHVQ